MTADLTNPIFQNEAAAIAHMEHSRWPTGVICPFCQSPNVKKMGGQTQAGMFLCNGCRDKFTVRTGSVFERSHIPLHKWLLATHLIASSKKGMSAHQLHRMLGITYKSAWFMAHRIREAMGPATAGGPIGGEGKIVEADELYIGRKDGTVAARGHSHKRTVVGLVERGGKVLSFHVDKASKKNIMPLVREHVARESRFMTDKAKHYEAGYGVEHQAVDHGKGEYVRGDAHSNTIEGVFSIFRRGMVGTYQHCGEQHLQRYLNEFDFRYNNRTALGVSDVGRASRILKGANGKRLTYRMSANG